MEKGDNVEVVKKHVFEFNSTPERKFEILTNKDLSLYLEKWYMKNNLKLQWFGFNKKYNSNDRQQFVSDFFNSNSFLADPDIDERDFGTLSSIDIEEVPCTILSLDFFDRILSNEAIIRKNGLIVQCYEELQDNIQIPNELRKLLLDPESDNYGLFSENEKKEFIFRIFKHFVIGGEYCQYENIIYHYLGMTKALYKDVISVYKDKDTIEIKADVFKVECNNKGMTVYPSKRAHVQDFAYFIVDPIASKLILLSHKWA